ncbi:MAG: biotin/lipoyl-binding protein [Desulfobacterales bacterium]|nr:biotin/lipoyl-binding protein [Desulfobacterales bacterium]
MKKRRVIRNLAVCGTILLAGVAAMVLLAGMKEAPVQTLKEAPPLTVRTVRIEYSDYPVNIEGYGSAVCRDTVNITPEVPGRVYRVNPGAEAGLRVDKGEILFTLDTSDFDNELARVSAREQEIRQQIKNLEDRSRIDLGRRPALERNQELARERFDRAQKLHSQGQVVSRSELETLETEWNTQVLALKQLERQLTAYAGDIRVARFQLAACRAELSMIRLNIRRCTVTAPFAGRIRDSLAEPGMQVQSGQNIMTLCNDDSLEIHVPLSAAELDTLFDRVDPGAGYPEGILGAPCTVTWTETGRPVPLKGKVARVIRYSGSSRTFLVAVTLDRETTHPETRDATIPFRPLEGMFCRVAVQGRPLDHVAKLPLQALHNGNTVYRVNGGQLEAVTVRMVRKTGATIFIGEGLSDGYRVAVSGVEPADLSRPVRVAENTAGGNHE